METEKVWPEYLFDPKDVYINLSSKRYKSNVYQKFYKGTRSNSDSTRLRCRNYKFPKNVQYVKDNKDSFEGGGKRIYIYPIYYKK